MIDRTYRDAIKARLRADLSPEHWQLVQQLVWLEGEEADQEAHHERERLLGALQERLGGIPVIETAHEIIATTPNWP